MPTLAAGSIDLPRECEILFADTGRCAVSFAGHVRAAGQPALDLDEIPDVCATCAPPSAALKSKSDRSRRPAPLAKVKVPSCSVHGVHLGKLSAMRASVSFT
jgi:hypothetical protein